MFKKVGTRTQLITLTLLILIAVFLPQSDVRAASAMTLEPITWNVIGLDSNRPDDGPNKFPVGVRACNPSGNTVDLTDVEADFVWLTGGTTENDDYIKLRPLSLDPIQPSPQIDLSPGECTDFYFEVEITRTSDAYDETRRYRIDVTYDDPDFVPRQTVSTPTPREIYVEHLISQNRNSTVDVELNGTSIPVGGTMSLMVGETYTISLDGSTATQGYEQIESFIHFPNTIFQILSAETTYSADTSANVDNPNDKLYGDSCVWENDPDNPNYRSCLSTGKNGGTIRVDYTIKIIGGAGTSDTLNSLIYDFSGSSYHYNSDFEFSYRNYEIIGPGSVTIAKRFVPDVVVTGDPSTLTITLTNPTGTTITGANLTDPLPAGMVVAATPNASTSSCGASATFAPAPGATSLSFANGVLAANSSCTIKVDVTVSSDGDYVNTTNNLLINNTVDTGNSATDTLTAGATSTACTPGQTLASWTIPTGSTANPPTPTTTGAGVSTAAASALVPARTEIETGADPVTSGDTTAWSVFGFKNDGQQIYFTVDTKSYSDVQLSFHMQNSSTSVGPTQVVLAYDGGSGYQNLQTINNPSTSMTPFSFNLDGTDGLANPSGNTTFRITASGANNDNRNGALYLENILWTGCLEPDPPPTLTKAFGTDPVILGNVSTLTFTIGNTDPSAVALTGVSFTDILPTGLVVADTPNASTTCSGTPNWAPTAGSTTLNFGTTTGATMAAGSTCTVSVDIKGEAAGQFDNISGYVTSNETGENKTSSGYATDSLTVIAPPSLEKSFVPTTILRDGTTSLSFTITNPNQYLSVTQDGTLTGVGFSDTLPAGLDITGGSSSVCGGGTLTLTDNNPAADTIALTGATLAAASSCTFSVTVTGTTVGDKFNLTGPVTSTEGGTGNSGSASVYVKEPTPKINILKQIGLTSDPTGVWGKFQPISTLPTNVYYKYILENIGDVPLTGITVTDSEITLTMGGNCTLYEPTTPTPTAFTEPLDPGDYVYCVVGPVTVSADGSIENTGTASGTYLTTTVTETDKAKYGTYGLTLAKSVDPGTFTAAGQTLDYEYLVTNSGYVPLEGPVSVSDDKVTVTCPEVNTVGDNDNYLDPGESITCTASYITDGDDVTAGSVTNTATATVDGYDSNEDSETAYIATDLSLRKSDGVTTILAGGTTTYSLTVTNNGYVASSGTITVVDVLPTGMSISDGTFTPGGTNGANWSCTAASNVITCTSSTAIAATGGTSVFDLTVDISATASGSLTNKAKVGGGGDPTNPSAPDSTTTNACTADDNPEGCAIDTDTAVSPNLSLSKTDGVTTVAAGGSTTYTLTVTNSGTAASTGTITVVDVLPTGMSVADGALSLGGTNAGDWSCSAASDVITCTSSTAIAASGGTSVFSFTVGVDATASGSLTNKAKVGGGGDPTNPSAPDATTTNACTTDDNPEGCAIDTDTAVSPNLSLSKTDGVTTVSAGGTTTYSLTVTNSGTAASTGPITVVDVLPTGMSVADGTLSLGGANAGDWSCSATSDVITCTSSTAIAASGGTSVFSFTVGVDATASGSLTNKAKVGGGGDPTNPTAPTSGTVAACTADDNPEGCAIDTDTANAPNLSLQKTDGVTTVSAGGSTTYSLTVTNSGTAASTGTITVVDVLPTGMSVADGALSLGGTNAGDWSCSAASDVITCTSSTAITASGGTSVFSFTVGVDATASGSLTNKAKVGGGGDPTNPSAPTSGTVAACTADDNPEGCAIDTDTAVSPNLSLSKTDGVTTVSAGGSTTYTLTVTNSGTAASTGTITVVDVLPTGMSVADGALSLGGTNAGDWSCSAASDVITCTSSTAIAATGGTSVFSFTVGVDATASGSLTNKAKVGGGGDPTNPSAPDATTTNACTADDNPEGCAIDTDTANAPNLSLQKTDGVTTVSAGGTTTYTLTVTNSGTAASTGTITVVDVLPTGMSVADGALSLGGTNAGDWSCSATSDVITCTSSTAIAASGGTSVFSFTVGVDATASGSLTNKAKVGGGGDPTNPSAPTSGTVAACTADDDPEGCAIDTDNAVAPNLSLRKSDGVTTVSPFMSNTYSLTVTNSGTADTTGTITVVDVLPTGMFVTDGALSLGGADAGDWSCAATSDVITCTSSVAIAASGGTSEFSFMATVDATASGSLTNKAKVGGGGDPTNPSAPTSGTVAACTADDNPEGCAIDTDTAVSPNLSLSKTDGVTTVAAGGSTTYSLTVTNSGTAASTGTITVVDVLPTGMSVADGALSLGGTNAGDWSCSATSDVITCTSSTAIAASGGTSVFSFTVGVDATASGSLTNKAKVGGGGDPTNPSAPTSGTVAACTADDNPEGCAIDINNAISPPSISKVFSPNQINVGETSSLVFTIQNPNAGETLTGVAFTDNYPAGVQNATPLTVVNTCGGSLTAAAGGTSISLSGGTIAADSNCSVTVLVEGITEGVKNNTSGNVSSTNGGTGNTATDTLTVSAGVIFDPPFGEKAFDADGLPLLRWTMVWINDNDSPVVAAVSDPIPAGTIYDTSVAVVTCTTDSASEAVPDAETITTLCDYEAPSATYPLGRIVWEGTLGPDDGAADADQANDELYISFYVRVDDGTTTVRNVATIDADLNGDEDTDDPGESQVATVSAQWTYDPGEERERLPETGFAPNQVTALPEQPLEQAYQDLGLIWLEIPSLDVQTSILGVPQFAGHWNVDWLWDQAGWLEGTAYPTTAGNSAITAHVYKPDGNPGPFVDLRTLRWGDQIIIHSYGQEYVYEVRSNRIVTPMANVITHEELPWVTLITCQSYDELTDSYRYRVVVKAVLVSVD